MISAIDKDFHRLDLSLERAASSRKELLVNRFYTGIDFLDDSTGGVFRGDLILLGAQTGRGKTQAASLIALNAAKQGKKVFYFALEAEKYEIERRLIFSEMISNLSAGEYMHGEECETEERRAIEKLKSVNSLYIYYKQKDFGVKDLQRFILSLQQEADVFIIDHFHFLDYDPSGNEIAEHKKALRVIRDTALDVNLPVVLLAHLNKAYAKSDKTIPSVYDFYGTSDLANICTKAITISGTVPEFAQLEQPLDRSATVFYVSKNRTDMSVAKFFGVSSYCHNTNKYLPGYLLADLASKTLLEPRDTKTPRWAKRSIVSRPYKRTFEP